MDREALLDLLNNRDLSDTHPNRRPRKASSLIVWRGSRDKPEILMGKRAETLSFMPGKYVFPGGAVERADTLLQPAQKLPPQDQARIGTQAQGLAMAAIRECYEETGLRIAAKKAAPSRSKIWKSYTSPGLRPDLSQLVFIARAITPPRRIRRFDTYFFACEASTDTNPETIMTESSEIQSLQWVPAQDADNLDVHIMTRIILAEIKQNLFSRKLARPFYRTVGGKFICSDIT